MFNINRFKENIAVYQTLPNNKFEVFVRPPNILLNKAIDNLGTETSTNEITRLLRYRIEELRLPSINILAPEVSRYGVGPTQKMPVNAQFQEIFFNILSDGYGHIWQFWHNWARTIFEFTGYDSANARQAFRIPTYANEYKQDYSTTMQIIVYDNFGNAIQKINLYDAFPLSIKENELSWNTQDELLKLNIIITFKEYTLVGSSLHPDDVLGEENSVSRYTEKTEIE